MNKHDQCVQAWTTYALMSLTPKEAADLVESLCDEGYVQMAFDVADALYWWLAHNHVGQISEFYRMMCALDYDPGAQSDLDPSIHADDDERGAASYLYVLLDQSQR